MSLSRETSDRRATAQSVNSVTFEPADGEYGVEVLDLIDRHRYLLWTPAPVSFERADPDTFPAPVDAAVSLSTSALTFPTVVPVVIRDETGTFLASVEQMATETLPEGRYCLEVAAPIRLYVDVHASVTVSSDLLQTYIDFGDETPVAIGATSYHEGPAATVTTTDEPRDVMAAVSTFASGLKTLSPERSFPSNRGHPPVVARGDSLRIPDGLEPPETEIRLEVPPDLPSIYAAAPLAYYLGAGLVPADRPRLVTETGFDYVLDDQVEYVTGVERTLKRLFVLDCVVRTEGVHPVALYERRQLESQLDVDCEALYGCPSAARLERYFEIPFSALEPLLPDWKVAAHVDPVPASVEFLPFLAHRLAVVHPTRAVEIAPPDDRQTVADEVRRHDGVGPDAPARGASPTSVRPARTGTMEELWIGEGVPLGVNKAVLEGYRNRIGRQQVEGDIELTVVYNEVPESPPSDDPLTSMHAERALIDEVYGSRSDFPFETTIHHNLTVAELRAVLETPVDFLHYIGHIDSDGIRCVDGSLDVATLEAVGPDSFFLNACRSYEQGIHLIEGGSIGGIATLDDVVNGEAIEMGQTIAQLLNRGFPLYAVHEIARDAVGHGEQYVVLGDGGLAIAQAESSVPNLCEIERNGEGFTVGIRTYPTTRRGLGTLFIPYVASNEEYFLSGGSLKPFRLSRTELRQFLALENVPIRIHGELRWSDDVDISAL
ncbi:hypothetical protein [Natrononativus amylolyticus]|uniref:hypothetical protein n=1 Tax=Natrononativus amylolyticus TaxID=2963434 RepID=UPI0020CE2352|nr:hypothetical protein [Natrononativus amylolyticus]